MKVINYYRIKYFLEEVFKIASMFIVISSLIIVGFYCHNQLQIKEAYMVKELSLKIDNYNTKLEANIWEKVADLEKR